MIVPTREKSLIVHLGLPRTGTGALKNFCRNNEKRLCERGWSVADPEEDSGHDASEIAFHLHRALRAVRAENLEGSQEHCDALSKQLTSAQIQNLLLWTSWPIETETPAWRALRLACDDAGWHLRLFAYIREQRSWLFSVYAKRVLKKRLSTSADRFLRKWRNTAMLDYLAQYRMLTQAVGDAQVSFLPFEPAGFDGQDICKDFLRVLSLPTEDWEFSETDFNASPGVIELELARVLNGLTDTAPIDSESFLQIAATSGLKSDRNLYRLASVPTSKTVTTMYRDANNELARLLFPDSERPLFTSELPEYYEQFRRDEILNTSSIELLVRYSDRQLSAAVLEKTLPSDIPEGLIATTMAKPVSLYREPYLKLGVHQIEEGVICEVLEERSVKKHRHIRGSHPEAYPIETEFVCGPVLAIKVMDALTDARTGITMTREGNPVRESVVVERLIESYSAEREGQTVFSPVNADLSIVLPLATQRQENYCRWWLDSIAKIYIASKSSLLREDFEKGNITLLSPVTTSRFQQQTLDLLRSLLQCSWRDVDSSTPFVASSAANSPGLTFGGGQHLGSLVTDYARFLQNLLPDLEPDERQRNGDLLYVSRNESSMRRILNEEDFLPGLRALGFNIVTPTKLSLLQQISLFRTARVIVSAHGAGLTNLLFSGEGTSLVEIFPEGGVHGSAFLRICSHRDFNYFFIVGEAVANKQSAKNPNNSDILLNVPASLALIREAVYGQAGRRTS